MTPQTNWKWFGNAGHFICGRWCRFHLCTQVGDYVISTVGEYVHPRHSAGSERQEIEFLREHPLGEPIGASDDALFETMVFKAGSPCMNKSCQCGMPELNGSELDGQRYSNRKDADEGHLKFCKKFARRK